MSWNHLIANWTDMMHRLSASFPHMDLNALQRFRGDRVKLEHYLAETHDLTLSEARETIEDWLATTGARIATQLAA